MGESRPTYQFGPFCLQVDRRLLLRDGVAVPLAPKALETLLALIEHRDRVLTKDELLRRIWGDTVVEEGGLTRNISVLRKALGETPDDHQYIVTVPGRGYRFVADVTDVSESAGEKLAFETSVLAASGDLALAGAATVNEPRTQLRRWRWVALSGLAALAAVALLYALRPLEAVDTTRPRITALAALPDIAQALKVDAVVEGSVQRSGDRVRINVQLIHASTDTHLWAREYESELSDVLKLQGEVARAVAEEIHVRITAEERARLASASAVDPTAYQEYLLGQHYLWKLNEEDLSRAIDCFERAIRLDPRYAAAHAGLSHAWWWRGVHGSKTARQVESPSRAAARRALELDPQLAEAHVSTGRIKFNYDWDWTGAERDFGRALELERTKPSDCCSSCPRNVMR